MSDEMRLPVNGDFHVQAKNADGTWRGIAYRKTLPHATQLALWVARTDKTEARVREISRGVRVDRWRPVFVCQKDGTYTGRRDYEPDYGDGQGSF